MIKLDANGRVVAVVTPQPGTESFYLNDGYIDVQPHSDIDLYRYVNGEWVITADSVNAAKYKAMIRINAARDMEERAGFTAYGKTFDSDATSLQRISLAVQAAQVIGTQFTIEWTCADNSTITLDYAQTMALPVIMAQAANALHVKARTLKAQIDAATTLEEINAVQW